MVPDERRGKLRLCKDTDGLTHMQWGVRAPDMPFTPEEDLLVFPREAEMKFIPKPGVFVIKFPDDPSRNAFFWSQRQTSDAEPQSDEALADVNAALNGEPAFARGGVTRPGAAAPCGGAGGGRSALSGRRSARGDRGRRVDARSAGEAEKQPVTEPMEDEPMKRAGGGRDAQRGGGVGGRAAAARRARRRGGCPRRRRAWTRGDGAHLAGMRPRGPGLNEVLTPSGRALLRERTCARGWRSFSPTRSGSESLER